MTESSVSIDELVRLHHAVYQEDIPFWIEITNNHNYVLELGCGHGRVSLPLLEAGRKILGLDRDWNALSYLKSRIGLLSLDLQNQIHLIQADIIDFFSGKKFDSIIFPCNTYSSFSSEERRHLLSNLVSMLNPGGVFMVSMPNPVTISHLYQSLLDSVTDQESELDTTFIHPEKEYPVQVSNLITLGDNGICWQWIYDVLSPDGSVERHCRSNQYHLSSLELYTEEILESGLLVDACLGDFDGSDYDQDSPHIILMAKFI